MSTSRTLVQPHEPVLAVALFTLEADGEIGRLIGGGPHQNAVVVDGVAQQHFLNGQRNVRQLQGKAQLGIGIQDVKLDIAIGKEDLLRWQLFSYLSPAQSGSFSPASHRTCAFQRIRRSIHTDSRESQLFPEFLNLPLRFGRHVRIVGMRIVHQTVTRLIEGHQIVDSVYIFERQIGIDPLCTGIFVYQPRAANPAFETVTIQSISPVHVVLKIILWVCAPKNQRIVWPDGQFIQTGVLSLFPGSLEVELSPFQSIGRFLDSVVERLFPLAEAQVSQSCPQILIGYRHNLCLISAVNTRQC